MHIKRDCPVSFLLSGEGNKKAQTLLNELFFIGGDGGYRTPRPECVHC